MIFIVYFLGLPSSLAFYPLTFRTKGRDISPNKNPKGRTSNVRYEAGPDKKPVSSIRFRGRTNSFVEFPKKARKPADEITVLAFLYPENNKGPILANANPQGVGIKFYNTKKGLWVRFSSRKKRFTRTVYTRKPIKQRVWSFVGVTYKRKTGVAKIFVNAKEYGRKNIGRLRVPLDYTLRTGAVGKDTLRGKVSCIQIYPKELTSRQIRMAKKLCVKTGR